MGISPTDKSEEFIKSGMTLITEVHPISISIKSKQIFHQKTDFLDPAVEKVVLMIMLSVGINKLAYIV